MQLHSGSDRTAVSDRGRIEGRPPNEVFDERQKYSRPLVEELRTFLDGLSHVLPRSGLGRAVTYANRLWIWLTVFLDQPDVPMHTNDGERAIRGPAVGRKNHYGSRNLETERVAAVWYLVVATSKQNGISPRDYIIDTLKAILTRKPLLMPCEWQAAGLMENVLGTD